MPAFAAETATSAENLGNEITELCGYIYVATYQLLLLIAEFDRRKYWEKDGFASCAHWLNFNCGFGLNSARERIRVAHSLGRLPKIADKFSTGELSYSKVRAITRVADDTNEDVLLNIAEHGTAHQVERVVAQYRRAQHLQNSDNAHQQYLDREVSYYYDVDGSLVMKLRMPPDQGELLLKALEKMMDRDAQDGESESTPVAARRADALAHIAETYFNNSEEKGSKADRYQVVVHVKDDSSEIENGPHVTAVTSQRIACDCSTVTIKEDERGEPLSVGRKTRTIPPAIRRALVSRDGGCRFPGCTNHRFVVGHHIQHWSDGGETSLDNLVLLCEHHHHLVHEGGFDCRRTEGGEIYFVDTRDEPLSEFVKPRPISIENILASLRQRYAKANVYPEVTLSAGTCRSKAYAGDRIDWSLMRDFVHGDHNRHS